MKTDNSFPENSSNFSSRKSQLKANAELIENLQKRINDLLFIYHNFKIGDTSQLVYFSILEVMAIVGVFLYLRR